MTEKLYYNDAYLNEFSATVISVSEKDGQYLTVLDQTAFFPTEGGQSCDSGTINGHEVLDVFENGGVIYHLLDKPLDVGSVVKGEVDFASRYDKMQQHTAEHIISGIINKFYGYNNVGFHLGSDIVTCDFDGALAEEDLLFIEDRANEVICSNLPIDAYFPSQSELADLQYRSKLELRENVRIVTIQGVDTCACCAPHVRATGEVLIVKILECISWRGGVRMTIAAGKRAFLDYRQHSKSVKEISVLLSAKRAEVSEAVKQLRATLEAEKQLTGRLYLRITELEAERFAATDGNAVVLLPDMPKEAMIAFSNKTIDRVGGILVVLSGVDGAYKYVISSTGVDLKVKVKEINANLSGKGGGNSQMLQGSFNAPLADIRAYFK